MQRKRLRDGKAPPTIEFNILLDWFKRYGRGKLVLSQLIGIEITAFTGTWLGRFGCDIDQEYIFYMYFMGSETLSSTCSTIYSKIYILFTIRVMGTKMLTNDTKMFHSCLNFFMKYCNNSGFQQFNWYGAHDHQLTKISNSFGLLVE